ncbi:GNAT family N-acetyltransferase [Micromonospora sp. NPDC006766]|uniref:GNAT family N-acetyltransferase n=1 Tax=Micromonospora sp. NPDC006766 TaxID=3154778 RepID=UPI0033F374E5
MITCTTCAGLGFLLEPCYCADGGNRLLVDGVDDVGEAYRDCRLCAGAGTVTQACVDCGRRERCRAQLVLTVVNVDTGVTASRSVVPGSVESTRDARGRWCLALAPLLRELTDAVGATGLIERRRPWEVSQQTLGLGPRWRPGLPAEQRYALEAEAIARHRHRPWWVLLGRSMLLPPDEPDEALGRLCALADLLCLDLVVEARRQPWRDPTWQVRFEVPGGEVPAEATGHPDLRLALATTSIDNALLGLDERGRTAPAYALRPVRATAAQPVVDLDRLGRRIDADLTRAPAAQAIWRDGRWWHTRLVPGGQTVVLRERETGQVARRRLTVLLRAAEPPAPSWQSEPIDHDTCPDCVPGSRLVRCDCVVADRSPDPACRHCSGAGFTPSVFPCPRCQGSRRLHTTLMVTVTDLRDRVHHELWRPASSGPAAESRHWLAGRYRLADRAAQLGVRPQDLTEADGGKPVAVELREGLLYGDERDPEREFVTRAAAGRPGARLIVVAARPDVPPLADLVRLAVGLSLCLAVTVRAHGPAELGRCSWGVQLVPCGTPPDRLDGPCRPSVEAAVAFCLRFLDNAVLAAVPVDPDVPIPVPQSPVELPLADPVPVLVQLGERYAGTPVAVEFSRGGCRIQVRGQDGWVPVAQASTLADAAQGRLRWPVGPAPGQPGGPERPTVTRMTLRLEPMTDEQYRRYRDDAEVSYAQHIAESGMLPPAEARQKARDDYARLLPDGLATEGHHLWTAYDGDVEVGMFWLNVERKSDGPHAFVYDFEVRPELRRKGYGRAIMEAAEARCREWGIVGIGLNVFAANVGARALYEQMGFEAATVQMRKRL